jgi:PIN domain nuclease of toxin-antitoxin system
MLNLDTHVLIHALGGTLTAAERRLLANDTWSISAIVLWETVKLSQLGRIELDVDDPEVRRTLASIHTWPLTLEICRAIRRLDFRSDPADELIAATSVVHGVALVTRDRRILKSRNVPLAH